VRATATVPDETCGPARIRAITKQLPFAEMVCLTLITQKVSYGWALGNMLAPDGEVGRIWSLGRPLTYRAIDGLVDKRLITRTGQAAGRGRDRVLLAPTPAGRRLAKKWLDTPVEHLRDVRIELLVKLALRDRVELDNAPLLEAQRAAFASTMDVLTSSHAADDFVDLWRRESARAVRRFLDQALHPPDGGEAGRPELQLSARNQLHGVITTVQHGEVMSTITAVLGDGQPVTAAITTSSATELDLAPSDPIVLIIKSTEVIVAKGGAAVEPG
jgi:PadR family transcriptional regulator AphA